MSNQYDNTNSGALFKNDKEGNEKRPDYKGKIDINGTEYRISAWIRTKKDGSGGKFMSLKAESIDQQSAPPQRQNQQYSAQAAIPSAQDNDTDDIPF